MIRATSVDELATLGGDTLAGCVVSIGNFDGVHRGHQALLARMRELASEQNAPSAIVTFFPPAKVLFGDATYLTAPDEKLALLTDFEPDGVAMIAFTRDYAATPKREFVARLARLDPSAIVVGEDFRFGHQREGGLADLEAVAPRLDVFGLETVDGVPVKSSAIREALDRGDVDRAQLLLGRPYRASGVVQHGQHRGASIGFPTANLQVAARKALPRGVFAVRVPHLGQVYDGMANVGPRPSFPEDPPSLEVHLFAFDGDLYGLRLEVEFHAFLRRQQTFANVDEVREQLHADAAAANAALAAPG